VTEEHEQSPDQQRRESSPTPIAWVIHEALVKIAERQRAEQKRNAETVGDEVEGDGAKGGRHEALR
jgi:hypothetical protein